VVDKFFVTFIFTDINYDRENFGGYKTWSLAVRKGYLRVFVNRMLRKITGLEIQGYDEDRETAARSLMTCAVLHQIYISAGQ
jgi:hypothetical protein